MLNHHNNYTIATMPWCYAFAPRFLKCSIYASVSCFIGQLANIRVYAHGGEETVMTWWGLTWESHGQTIGADYGLGVSIALLTAAFVANQLFLPILYRREAKHMLYLGGIYILVMGCVSQLAFSSVMRVAYETSFYAIVLIGLFVDKHFTSDAVMAQEPAGGTSHSQRLWHLLRMIVPVSVAWPAAVLGINLLRHFFGSDSAIIKVQLYRHATMMLLTMAGFLVLVIIPVLARIVEVEHGNE
jgi:hypothetical protein